METEADDDVRDAPDEGSAFGVSYGVPLVSDEVRPQLEAQFVDPAPL